MSKYSLELRYMTQGAFEIFDFEYDFYEPSLKEQFEQKFVDYYYEHEISAPTPESFKHRLKTRLNIIMPYYKQLYISEQKAKDIEFLLNKDLKETFIREITSNDKITSNSNSVTSDNINSESVSIDSDTPQTMITDIDKYMSSATKDNSNSNSSGTSDNITSSENIGNNKEETTLISQGNIGTTSSAELLEKWRSVMINIDLLIIDELKDLFLLVY